MEYLPEGEKPSPVSQEPWALAGNELRQAIETGHDVAGLRPRLDSLSPRDEAELLELHREILTRPRTADWPHTETSALEEIEAALPQDAASPTVPTAPTVLGDRIHGAWHGRIIGNIMGKPFEIGPTRESIRGYLEAKGAYPLTGFVPFDDLAERDRLGRWGFEGITAGRIHGSVRDDDIDYTVLGLHLLETYGTTYTARDVAAEWLARFPVYQLYTAERATYQNLIRGVPLAQAGEHHNPYREWIGALIRADIFGFAAPGHPRKAALLSYQDAALSHRANGIYGAMWAAALISSAFTAATPEESVAESLRHVPASSRLGTEIQTVLAQFRRGMDWEKCLDDLHARHSGMSWVHTINNAGALTAALLWGEGRFGETVGLAVQSGLDTDSIGATAGAWAGAYLGLSGIPTVLVDPLEDRCRSGVFGFGDLAISSLAERTLALVEPQPK
ncbi:ADP-ribosylglycohydrolase family protein [Sphaerisporangium perillae]|uniref:ADP-ribosylglycohydrolase family protein n=1 Tax=Sphaerisporangium perillae TaxID=2935860 RepID=UPI00200C4762|nr:ADP-ribosylglycohydrolase family protein [Sphaerisporangium perillae]